jgi:hypothetical protein
LYAKASGKDIRGAIKTHAIGRSRNQGDRYLITVSNIGKEDGTVELTRDDLLKLIQDARKKGQLLKDPVYGTPYYKREVTSDLPK